MSHIGIPIRSVHPGNTASDASFRSLSYWLSRCISKHEICGDGSPQPLPTRILEIQKGEECLRVKLICPSQEFSARYICLSHCWGAVHPECRTTKHTFHKNCQNMPWDTMPKTFQDAAIVSDRLGVKYLWIDSICIDLITLASAVDWLTCSQALSRTTKRTGKSSQVKWQKPIDDPT